MTPYFDADGITLYHGDCRDILPGLGLQFDACIADPPYNETSLDWDLWPDGWPEVVRAHTACLWCFGSFRMFMERMPEFSEWRLAQEIVWEKQNGSGFATDRFMRVHELAVQFYDGKWTDLRREVPKVSAKKRRFVRGSSVPHRGGDGGSLYDSDTRLERSVIYAANCQGYAVNETQKPEAIVAPLLEYSVAPGGLVLDCFAGSGTTLAVARRMGIRAVGIEKRESQCEEIAKRLAQRVLQLV